MGIVTNQTIAAAFERLADLMDILGQDTFRIGSYRKVARVVAETGLDVPTLAREERLEELPGVGKSSAQKIKQLVETGKIDLLEELSAQVPPGLVELLEVPGLGPKTVAHMWKQANVTDVESLTHAIEDGSIERVERMGAKKVRQIFESLQYVTGGGQRMRLGEASRLAEMVVESLGEIKGVRGVEAAGSLRRGRETVGDLDFVAVAEEMEQAERILKEFTTRRKIGLDIHRVLGAGGTKASVVLDRGVQADIRVVAAESFGAAMQYFTGSKEHNVRLRELAIKRGLKLNEYGLFRGEKRVAGASEEEIYAELGLEYVPPELRENAGEIEAAAEGKLPKLVEIKDIRGDLHLHTLASDGTETIANMIGACKSRGYKYMGIADHSKSQVQANGLDSGRLESHGAAVREAAKEAGGIEVFFSCEVDILKDGSLDFDDKTLERLDFVIAAPHAGLAMGRTEATRRIIRAIENPYVRIVAHPTGRLINSRPGMEIDIGEVAAAAAEHDVALEINASPYRLDLRDGHVRAAVEAGAKIAINTDSHGIKDLEAMEYGVVVARRGWARAADVVNAWPAGKFRQWVKGKKVKARL